MNATLNKTRSGKTASDFQRCKFCGEQVNLNDEGNTYRDGSFAHEACADSHQFTIENEADFRD